jgi:hypothetical protein
MCQILPELQDKLKSFRTLPTPPAIALQLIDLWFPPQPLKESVLLFNLPKMRSRRKPL